MDAERLFIEEIGVIIARFEMRSEQLRLHVEVPFDTLDGPTSIEFIEFVILHR
jgi:hypothetical protein